MAPPFFLEEQFANPEQLIDNDDCFGISIKMAPPFASKLLQFKNKHLVKETDVSFDHVVWFVKDWFRKSSPDIWIGLIENFVNWELYNERCEKEFKHKIDTVDFEKYVFFISKLWKEREIKGDDP